MRYFPIFVDLKDRPVVVVGGGEEALRKVRLLLKTDAKIGIVAAELHQELRGLADAGRIEWIGRAFVPMLLDDAALAYSADAGVNDAVSAAARERGIPVNAVDDAALSSFIVPSIVDRDPVVVAIGTEGTAPVLAQGIRAKIDQMLPTALGKLAKTAEALRPKVAETLPAGSRRRGFWQKFFFGALRDAFLANNSDAYERELNQTLSEETAPAIGRVSLVGAGPGDAELLTLKAHRKLQEADVIVYDRLVGPGVLELARRDAVRIAVGKTPFERSPKQSEINRILIREAKAGKHVVRLKGGDPYVFGRGGEEQAALEANGIAVDVVPGVTAALGCAASIGLPVTQRGQNRAFTLLTGSSEDGIAEHDWAALAKPGQAFAIYMGVNAAGDIAARLLDAGIAPSTPVTIVENGTLENERVFVTSIGGVWETLTIKGVVGPAILYVGLAPAKTSADIVPFPVREDIRDAVLKAAS
jgi:uroporphyrin-III C-methyltransferase / precorrin-2 dehydrogenase / sirohydrochlorin ferrochelatase